MVFEDAPFVAVAWIGAFDIDSLGIDFEEQIDNLRKGDIADVRPLAIAPADVEPDAFCRDAVQGVIDRSDVLRQNLSVVVQRPFGELSTRRRTGA